MTNPFRPYALKPATEEALQEIAGRSPSLAEALIRLGQAAAEKEARWREMVQQRRRNTLLLRQHRTILVRQIASHAKEPGPSKWPKLRLVVDNA